MNNNNLIEYSSIWLFVLITDRVDNFFMVSFHPLEIRYDFPLVFIDERCGSRTD